MAEENPIFRPLRSHWIMNACVGSNGPGSRSLDYFYYGYAAASQSMIETCKQESACLDTLIYPICQNFRHAMEAFCKSLGDRSRDLASLQRVHGAALNHDVSQQWEYAKEALPMIGISVDSLPVKLIDFIADNITKIDPKGFSFRYHADKFSGSMYLSDYTHFNIIIIEKNIWRFVRAASWLDLAIDYISETNQMPIFDQSHWVRHGKDQRERHRKLIGSPF